MKNFFRRGVFILLAIVIQIVWLFLLINNLSEKSTLITWILNFISMIVVVYIINKDENPQSKLSWIFFILLMPILGGILYVITSGDLSIKALKSKMNKKDEYAKKYLPKNQDVINKLNLNDTYNMGPINYLVSEDFPIYENTLSEYYPLGQDAYVSMIEELKKAKHFIFLEYFIIAKGVMWDKIAEILIKKAKEGLDVRIIYDDFGSMLVVKEEEINRLKKNGIKVIPFNPLVPLISIVMNHRDHRKIMIIDGNTSFTGGINIADEYINIKSRFGKWKDTAVMLKGDGVRTLTLLFLNMWNSIVTSHKSYYKFEDKDYSKFMPYYYEKEEFETDGYVIPYGHSPLKDEAIAENVYLNIINNAKKYLYICSPYLIIDYNMQTALVLAAKRGVDVRILIPGIPDKKIIYQVTRANYPKLIKSGIKVYEYTPGFSHSKCFVCDDEIATVGTINMDYRSLYLHFEDACYFYKSSLIKDIKNDFDKVFRVSKKCSLKKNKVSMIRSIYYAILRLLAPLL